jgi:hypothetical protein
VVAIGTILAAFPGRRRKPTDPVSMEGPSSVVGSPDTEPEPIPLASVTSFRVRSARP